MLSFYERLEKETEEDRNQLFSAPIFAKCFSGDVCREDYIEFLTCAYHHVKHTVPLLMAVGARLPEDKEWLRVATAHYIEEEIGHQEWILNDIENSGGNKNLIRGGKPNKETEFMVSYAYDMVNRVNPLGFFGMVQVLEGTSIATADQAATSIQAALGLPSKAFSYLKSHGALDLEHIEFFKGLMNQITDKEEQDLIIHAAKNFYLLYGNIFRSLTTNSVQQAA